MKKIGTKNGHNVYEFTTNHGFRCKLSHGYKLGTSKGLWTAYFEINGEWLCVIDGTLESCKMNANAMVGITYTAYYSVSDNKVVVSTRGVYEHTHGSRIRSKNRAIEEAIEEALTKTKEKMEQLKKHEQNIIELSCKYA